MAVALTIQMFFYWDNGTIIWLNQESLDYSAYSTQALQFVIIRAEHEVKV
jgi:hypothetical protein